MKYRSRSDIIGLILEAANGGATKTKIMYKAFLSFAQMREYLSTLLEKDLIRYEEGSGGVENIRQRKRGCACYTSIPKLMKNLACLATH